MLISSATMLFPSGRSEPSHASAVIYPVPRQQRPPEELHQGQVWVEQVGPSVCGGPGPGVLHHEEGSLSLELLLHAWLQDAEAAPPRDGWVHQG